MILFILEVAALCFPALLNRGPILFTDTHGYYMGGRAALRHAAALLAHQAAAGGAESADTAVQNARAVRSVFYALFTFLLGNGISLWAVVIVQALIAVLVLRCVFDLACPGRPPAWRTAFIGSLALLSTASWTVSFAMPDVFTPAMVLCIGCLAVWWEQMRPAARWLMALLIAASVVMHVTNPPIALGVIVVAMLLRRGALWRRYALMGGAVAVGVAATLMVSVVGFKEWTLSPHAPPFLLARSIGDGPGRLYLQQHCPRIGLDMCGHLDRLDVSVNDFLWEPESGVYSAVPPAEQAVLRRESTPLYVAAALEHPWLQGKAILRDTLEQLVTFSLAEYRIPSSAIITDDEMILRPWHQPDPRPILFPGWQAVFSVPEYAVVIGALGYLGWRRGLPRSQYDLLILILTAIVLQAAIGGVFSDPSARYEARVIWLIPLAALLAAFSRHRRVAG